MTLLYNLAIMMYVFAIRLAAMTGNSKARLWIDGRKDWRKKLAASLRQGEVRIWFHCSSLGEFEQARPVMEKLKRDYQELKIVLTFFSPSGFEVRKNYPGADYIFYLPADSSSNASDFISLIEPRQVLFTKYEYWHHYFHCLKEKGIPLYMISAIFRPADRFFTWYGGFFRDMLKCVTYFFVQDDQSLQLLQHIGFTNAVSAGDTRFDRVLEIASHAAMNAVAAGFSEGQQVIVAGSTWEADEKMIAEGIMQAGVSIKLIVAPHEISGSRIAEVKSTFADQRIIEYSMAGQTDLSGYDVLLIDNMGMLSSLYRYGNCAYVGGGFGKGIHNTLEAAVYGIPVLFGPNHDKFIEAKELIACGGAISVASSVEFREVLKGIFGNEGEKPLSGSAAASYVKTHSGATDKIISVIFRANS